MKQRDRRPQGTLQVYETEGKAFHERKAADGLFAIEAEKNASTLFLIDRGELAIVQGKRAARITEELAEELRGVLNEYMNGGRFTVGI